MGGVVAGAAPVYLSVEEFVSRVGERAAPLLANGTTDTARIEQTLADASAVCRALLPDDLVAADGRPLTAAAIDARVGDALPGIVCDIARFRLADGATGASESVTEQYRAAMATLQALKREPDREGVQAALVEGASQWIPGEAPAAEAR